MRRNRDMKQCGLIVLNVAGAVYCQQNCGAPKIEKKLHQPIGSFPAYDERQAFFS